MLVCHCKQVSDSQIRAAVRSGARTRAEVSRACEAGTRCGGCVPMVEEILTREVGPQAATRLESAALGAAPSLG